MLKEWLGQSDPGKDLPSVVCASLKVAELRSIDQLALAEQSADILALAGGAGSRYLVGIAASQTCIEAALALRYQVFYQELGEGLEACRGSGLDRDQFDDQMHHIVLIDQKSDCVAGTYRVQCLNQAQRSEQGIYSAQLFDLAPLLPYFPETMECGRACLSKQHRSFNALLRLWQGLGHYMNLFHQRYLFGCCSLTSTDPKDGWRALKTLRRCRAIHDSLWLRTLQPCSCGRAEQESDPALESLPIPKLFKIYLRLGAQVISEPAIDRDFGTVDFLVLLDTHQVRLSALEIVQ
jgi:putative hemolysin